MRHWGYRFAMVLRLPASLLIPCWVLLCWLTPLSGTAQEAALETYCDRVIDGWTLHSPDFGEIRFLGIEPLDGREKIALEGPIKKELSFMVEGKKIKLEFEGPMEDSRGRLLAYVLKGEVLLNAWILKNGYGRISPGLRPLKHQPLFQDQEKDARIHRRGIWGLPPPIPTEPSSSTDAQKAMAPKREGSPPQALGPMQPSSPGKIIASKKSRYYYRPGQFYYDKVESRHRVYFESGEAARRAGFRPYLKD
jgi:endonuclease YncB( thermonuclease family)